MRNRARLRKISRNSAKRKQKTARYAAEPVKIDLIRVSLGLDFAMVATFIAIVVPQLVRLPHFVAAATAGSIAYLLQDLPYKLGLLAAIVIGVGAGLLLSQLRTIKQSETEHA